MWYVVADTEAGLRHFGVDRVVGRTERRGGERPEGFDLEEAWAAFSEQVRRQGRAVEVRGLARADAIDLLQRVLGTRLLTGHPAGDGRIEIAVSGPSERAVLGGLAGFGAMVEVQEPASARQSMAVIAAELSALYGPP